MKAKKQFIIGPGILILAWIIITQFNLVSEVFLPGPLETLNEIFFLFKSGIIFPDLIATVSRTINAFLIAALFGVPTGLFLGYYKETYRNLEFIIDFFRSTPVTALFPLFLLFFGVGDKSKIALAFFSVFLTILFNTSYGVMHANQSRILAAKTMGASKWQTFKHIIFWESLPQTSVGLRISISYALIVIVITEMFIGTTVGLGHLIIDSQMTYNIKTMYAAIIITGILGYLLNYSLLYAEKHLIHWSGK